MNAGAPAPSSAFGYVTPDDGRPMCRSVYKWLQSLDLAYSVKKPRRDFANGFLVAELLSRYFPKDISMLTFSNGASAPCRADNWEQVQRACKRNAFRLPPKTVDAVIAEQPGAAVALVELIYEHLTQKKLTRPEDVTLDDTEGQEDAAATRAEAAGNGGEGLPSVAGSHAIQPTAAVPEALQFGEVQQRYVEDGIALRAQLQQRQAAST